MFKLLTTFFVTLLLIQTFAQDAGSFKISGTVVSSYSGEPIAGGVIKFAKNNGVVTDSLGRFTIKGLSAGQYKLSFSAFGYDNRDIIVTITNADNNFNWKIQTDDCLHYSRETALRDIGKGEAVLLLQGGIVPVVYTTDQAFINKYGVGLHDFGCVAADKQDCLIAYNKTVFQYLDNKYGKKWRKEVRKDIIGLKK